MIVLLSAASAGAVSTTLGGSTAVDEEDAGEAAVIPVDSLAVDPVAGAGALIEALELTASAGGAELAGAAVVGNMVAAAGDETGVGAATFAARVVPG